MARIVRKEYYRRPSVISQNPRDPRKPRHTGVLFVQTIPSTTKLRFKAACAVTDRTERPGETRGESMRDALIKLMRLYIHFQGVPEYSHLERTEDPTK